jgi:hypothetical protein
MTKKEKYLLSQTLHQVKECNLSAKRLALAVGKGMGSLELGVWSLEFGVWSFEFGVGSWELGSFFSVIFLISHPAGLR